MPSLLQRTLMLSKLLLPLLFVFSQAYAIEEDELLPVEEAYIPTVTVAGDVATLNFIVAPGYYLYKERISLEAARPAEVVMGPLEMPAGEEKTDEFFGKMHVFHQDFTGTSKLTFPAARPGLVAFRLKYQGCADVGVCYPPQTRTFAMDLGGGAANALAQSENPDAPAPGMISGITDPASATPQAWQGGGLTTPDAVQLHRALHDFVRRGAMACAIEASSIGIAEHRSMRDDHPPGAAAA